MTDAHLYVKVPHSSFNGLKHENPIIFQYNLYTLRLFLTTYSIKPLVIFSLQYSMPLILSVSIVQKMICSLVSGGPVKENISTHMCWAPQNGPSISPVPSNPKTPPPLPEVGCKPKFRTSIPQKIHNIQVGSVLPWKILSLWSLWLRSLDGGPDSRLL